jgi:hypothetical protein
VVAADNTDNLRGLGGQDSSVHRKMAGRTCSAGIETLNADCLVTASPKFFQECEWT